MKTNMQRRTSWYYGFGKKWDVFFSYGHDRNKEIVMRLVKDLEEKGYQIWIDVDGIRSGDDWRRKISEGIFGSESMLSFVSEHSVRRPGVCLDELSIAVAVKGAQIQSVLLEKDVDPPMTVSYRQYIDMSDWRDLWGTEAFELWYEGKFREVLNVIDSPESRAYAEEMLFIRETLHPELLSARKESLTRKMYCGRGWLKQEMDEKLAGSRRHLLLLGSPGCGKSSFMAHEFVHNPNVGAVVFCEWDNPMLNNIDSIGRTIAFQLASRMPDFRYRLIGILQRENGRSAAKKSIGNSGNGNAGDTGNGNAESTGKTVPGVRGTGATAVGDMSERDDNSFRRYVIEPLRYLVDGERPDTYILIDGIDEMKNGAGRRHNELAEILERFSDEFPRWIRFIVSSRNDPASVRPLAGFCPIQIDDSPEHNRQDILTFVTITLRDQIKEPKDIEKLADMCAGNFLYASMVCDAILSQGLSVKEALKDLRSLGRVYLRNFNRTFAGMDLMENGYYEALCALCMSPEPLPVHTLQRGLSWRVPQVQNFRKILGPYLNSSPEELGIFHKSLVDWLLSEEAEEYQIDPETGTEVIAEACYGAWLRSADRMNEYELKYLRRFLVEAADSRLKEVLASEELGEVLLGKAREYQEKKAFADALVFAEEAVILFGGLTGEAAREKCLAARRIVIAAYDTFGDLEHCRRACLDAVEYLDKTAPGECGTDKAWFYDTLGQQEGKHSRFEAAQKWYDAARDEYLACGDGDGAILAQARKALCCRMRGNLKQSIRILEQIRKTTDMEALSRRNPGLSLFVRMNLGYCYFSNSKYLTARPLLEGCLAEVERLGEKSAPRYIAQTQFLMSVIEFASGNFRKGIGHADAAIEMYSEIYGKDSVEICSSLNEKGLTLLELGEWQQARACFERSYAIRSDYYGEQSIATSFAMLNLAKAQIASKIPGEVAKAVPLLEKVIDIRLALLAGEEENINIAMVAIELGHAWEFLGNTENARLWAERAMGIYHRLGNEMDEGRCLFLRARLLMTEGERAKEAGQSGKEKACLEEAAGTLAQAEACMLRVFPDGSHPYIREVRQAIGNCEAIMRMISPR